MADEIIAHGITREVHRQGAVLRVMAKHPELCFVLITVAVTILTNYGSSIKNTPVVIPARTPQPLFPIMSSVMDLYLGDLRPLVDMLQREDLVFVMYYAPWCAKSQNAVSQYLKAAQYLKGQVPFVAVNCWYPEGLCRKQYKFLLYPVFFAYHKNNDGYRFMGIERAEFMVKFLEDLLNPLTLLTSKDHIKDFLTEHDTVVVGHFDFDGSPQPPGFQQFYYAAMRVVEHDPYQPIKFGLVTDHSLAVHCHATESPDIVFLRINNSSLKYPLPNNITSTNLVKWIFSNRLPLPVRWIVPLGMKSLGLSKEINKGPAIIMFHRATPLSSASQSVALFKDLALRYNQCPGDGMAADFSRRWRTLSIHNVLEYVRVLNLCKDFKQGQPLLQHSLTCCISTASQWASILPGAMLNVCEICQHRSGAQRSSMCVFESGDHDHERDSPFSYALPSNSCRGSISNYDVSSYTSVCCKWCNKNISNSEILSPPSSTSATPPHLSGGRRPTDRYVLDSLENLPRKLCSRLTFQKRQEAYPTALIPDFASINLPEEFTGRGCRANRSLSFLTLDSQNHWMIAESLGLDVSQAHVSPVVVAFDKENELQVLLKAKFSKFNTASFIVNFTQGLMPRYLRSVSSERSETCGSLPSLCVTELSTDTFQAAIAQPKDVVILVYAGWCGFCVAVSHTFLHLARYFHTSPNITFARINGEANDLPWEFSVESYPTIIFFPADRKSDSVAFPDDLTASLPNLIRFILQHTGLSTRLHLVADVCTPTCVQENLDLCRHTVRVLRSKLQSLQSRLGVMHSTQNSTSPSVYHSTVEKILVESISSVQSELKEVKTVQDFLQNSKGNRLDRKDLEDVLSEKMQRKKSFVGS